MWRKHFQIVGINQPQSRAFDSVIEVKVGGTDLVVGVAEPISASNVNILVPVAEAKNLWKRLVDDGARIGLQPCGIDALEIHRIESGFPVYGRELIEDVNPLEAGLERFVSLTKGCYIGQEVIARLDTYKKLQKRLMGLLLGDDSCVVPGARVSVQERDVGLGDKCGSVATTKSDDCTGVCPVSLGCPKHKCRCND